MLAFILQENECKKILVLTNNTTYWVNSNTHFGITIKSSKIDFDNMHICTHVFLTFTDIILTRRRIIYLQSYPLNRIECWDKVREYLCEWFALFVWYVNNLYVLYILLYNKIIMFNIVKIYIFYVMQEGSNVFYKYMKTKNMVKTL